VRLLGDRFYGTADLIGWCQERGWDYRLRLKGNLVVVDGTGRTTTGQCAKDRIHYLENVELTARRPHRHHPRSAEPWIIAMSEKPGYLPTLEYSARWGIEPMFSDFKSRGFGIEDTQLRYADRLDRLILVMVLRDNQNHVRCVNQASLTLVSFIHRKLHPAIMMSGRQTTVKPSPSGSRRWRLRA
jgi:Transposase DDE domain